MECTERYASGAADSRSEERAEAIGGRLQANVRLGVLRRLGGVPPVWPTRMPLRPPIG